MSWSKASSLFLLSPFLLSSAVPLVILQTKPITPESIYSFAHTFTFVLPVIHVHNAVWREKNKAHWYIGSHFEALCALWALCASITKSLSEGKVPIILKSFEIEIAPLSKDLTIEITPCWLSVKVQFRQLHDWAIVENKSLQTYCAFLVFMLAWQNNDFENLFLLYLCFSNISWIATSY